MHDTTHLIALQTRLASEKQRLNDATNPREIALRLVWVTQIEKEIFDEKGFLGFEATEIECSMTDDELLSELGVDVSAVDISQLPEFSGGEEHSSPAEVQLEMF